MPFFNTLFHVFYVAYMFSGPPPLDWEALFPCQQLPKNINFIVLFIFLPSLLSALVFPFLFSWDVFYEKTSLWAIALWLFKPRPRMIHAPSKTEQTESGAAKGNTKLFRNEGLSRLINTTVFRMEKPFFAPI